MSNFKPNQVIKFVPKRKSATKAFIAEKKFKSSIETNVNVKLTSGITNSVLNRDGKTLNINNFNNFTKIPQNIEINSKAENIKSSEIKNLNGNNSETESNYPPKKKKRRKKNKNLGENVIKSPVLTSSSDVCTRARNSSEGWEKFLISSTTGTLTQNIFENQEFKGNCTTNKLSKFTLPFSLSDETVSSISFPCPVQGRSNYANEKAPKESTHGILVVDLSSNDDDSSEFSPSLLHDATRIDICTGLKLEQNKVEKESKENLLNIENKGNIGETNEKWLLNKVIGGDSNVQNKESMNKTYAYSVSTHSSEDKDKNEEVTSLNKHAAAKISNVNNDDNKITNGLQNSNIAGFKTPPFVESLANKDLHVYSLEKNTQKNSRYSDQSNNKNIDNVLILSENENNSEDSIASYKTTLEDFEDQASEVRNFILSSMNPLNVNRPSAMNRDKIGDLSFHPTVFSTQVSSTSDNSSDGTNKQQFSPSDYLDERSKACLEDVIKVLISYYDLDVKECLSIMEKNRFNILHTIQELQEVHTAIPNIDDVD